MKKLTLIAGALLATTILVAQYNKIDTSFYSPILDEVKMADVYFPPGYDENPDLHYPVIYYLHGWTQNQNNLGTVLTTVQTLINTDVARQFFDAAIKPSKIRRLAVGLILPLLKLKTFMPEPPAIESAMAPLKILQV